MTVNDIDLEALDEQQIQILIARIQDDAARREAERQNKVDDVTASITQSIQTLTNLLGPESPEAPGTSSIREIRLYPTEVMAENAGLALSLVFEGLEILATTMRDIARARSNAY